VLELPISDEPSEEEEEDHQDHQDRQEETQDNPIIHSHKEGMVGEVFKEPPQEYSWEIEISWKPL
jgi:hypothetical protein